MKFPLLHVLAKIFAYLVGVASRCEFAVPSTIEAKYLFTGVLAIIVFSSVRCPFLSFAHFYPHWIVSFFLPIVRMPYVFCNFYWLNVWQTLLPSYGFFFTVCILLSVYFFTLCITTL